MQTNCVINFRIIIIIRPLDTHSLSTFVFLFRRLISELAERNSTKIGHMLGSNCDLTMHVQNLGYPLRLQIGGTKKPPFWTTVQLNGNFNGPYFRTKHDIDNQSTALTTTRCLLHRPKMSWTLVYKRLRTEKPFLPTLCKFCFLHHCQAS